MSFINFFSLLGHPYQLQILLSGFAVFSVLVSIYFLYKISLHDKITRSFMGVAVFAAFWAFFGLLAYLGRGEHYTYIFHILSIAFVPFFSAALASFAITFYEESREEPSSIYLFFLKALFFGAAAVMSMLLFFDAFQITASTIYSVHKLGAPYFIALGAYMRIFASFFFLSLLLFIYLFSRSLETEGRKQAAYVLSSFVLSLLLGGFYFFVHPALPVFLAFLTPLPIFFFGTAIGILKTFPMNWATTRTRITNVAIWFLIFVHLLLEEESLDFALSLAVLALSIILGTLLVRANEKEAEQKEEMEKLNEKLQKFNANLEWEVSEQVHDIERQKAHTDAIINSLSVGLIEYTEDFEVLRMNNKAEEFLGLDHKEGKYLKFQPSHKETFNPRYQSLKEVLFSDLSIENQKSRGAKKFPVRKEDGESFQRVEKLVIDAPVIRVLEVITFPMATIHGKDQKPSLYIKLLRDVTGENRHTAELQAAKNDDSKTRRKTDEERLS